jgi:hypothetical protein
MLLDEVFDEIEGIKKILLFDSIRVTAGISDPFDGFQTVREVRVLLPELRDSLMQTLELAPFSSGFFLRRELLSSNSLVVKNQFDAFSQMVHCAGEIEKRKAKMPYKSRLPLLSDIGRAA